MTRTLGPMVTIAGALGVWLAVMATVGATASPRQDGSAGSKPVAAASAAQAVPPSGYAGEQTCLTCHEDMKKGYHGGAHARTRNARTPAANQGCESCHGPGQEHVNAGGDKTKIKQLTKISAREASETCTTCHNRSEHQEWAGGKHDARNISCLSCHSVHQPKSEKAQLKTETQIETCVQCHFKEVSKVRKSSHMPVQEGKMECSTCHNPHGSQNVKMLRKGNSITESCASCHAEKRGPFLWEHAVGRENCVTCHDPHGSNNDRMLVAKQPMLCQKCHIHARHPSTIYDTTQVNNKSNRILGRGCVNCHSQVHGSNHPTSGKYFMR
ncbi:MAG TPA: DmsE family decaheme c-type cytochrome [Vicinamibacterales bacterium]|nr:DmsE family decaheme c-type cytochrome [Vicinamibacterales bacterium]